MSQRNRPRGSNRNSEAGGHGEEAALWESIQRQAHTVVDNFNDSSTNVLDIRDEDKNIAGKKEKGSECWTKTTDCRATPN
jgi:SAGA-associated factor 29